MYKGYWVSLTTKLSASGLGRTQLPLLSKYIFILDAIDEDAIHNGGQIKRHILATIYT